MSGNQDFVLFIQKIVLPSDYDIDDEDQSELAKDVLDSLAPSTFETNGTTEKQKSKSKSKKKGSAKTSSGNYGFR